MKTFYFKKWVMASTALSFMVQQISPAFAMMEEDFVSKEKPPHRHYSRVPASNSNSMEKKEEPGRCDRPSDSSALNKDFSGSQDLKRNETDNNNSNSIALRGSSTPAKGTFSRSTASLPEELVSSQNVLQALILKSTRAQPDTFSPLVQEIRQIIQNASNLL